MLNAPDIESRADGVTVRVFKQPCAEWERHEQELAAARFPLPLPHRCAWARTDGSGGSWFVAVRDRSGMAVGGLGAEARPSRALPGRLLLRVQRLGVSGRGPAGETALAALVATARADRRVLRLNVEACCRDPEVLADLSAAADRLGLRRLDTCRGYTHTLAVDLTPPEEQIFASFSRTGRRDTRAVGRKPVTVGPIHDPVFAPRIDQLYRETMARTGDEREPADWSHLISFSRRHPDLSRLVGLFRGADHSPSSLLAFARGCFHVDHVHYDLAASTRDPALNVPLGYALIWDLIRWAKASGATWFDFGGVTSGRWGDRQDPLGGISDFKRHFSKTVVEVGAEWVLEPRPVEAKLAAVIRTGAAPVVRLLRHARRVMRVVPATAGPGPGRGPGAGPAPAGAGDSTE